MEGEDAGEAIAVDAGELAAALPLGKHDDADDEEGVEQQDEGAPHEALLLTDGAEDEVGVLLGHVVELGLRTVEEPLAPQAARADGYLRLVDVVPHARGVVLDAEEHEHAHLLVGLQLVDKQVARVVEAYRAQGEEGDEEVRGVTLHHIHAEEVESRADATDELHDADVEWYDIAREEPGYERSTEIGTGYPHCSGEPLAIDAHHEGSDEGDEQEDDELAHTHHGHGFEEVVALPHSDDEVEHGTNAYGKERAGHALAVEHEEEGEVDECRAGLVLQYDEQHGHHDKGDHLGYVGTLGHGEAVSAQQAGEGKGGGKLGELGRLYADGAKHEP